MSSDSEPVNEDHGSYQFLFIMLLKKERVLINKSQRPSVKAAKQAAMARFKNLYEEVFGKSITTEQVQKKLNNMKNEVKRKSNRNVIGKNTVVLKPWEKELLQLLQNGSHGLTICYPESKATSTLNKSNDSNPEIFVKEEINETFNVDAISNSTSEQNNVSSSGPIEFVTSGPSSELNTTSSSKRNLSSTEEHETEETKTLSTPELQRLVLLEQLAYIREKRQKLKAT